MVQKQRLILLIIGMLSVAVIALGWFIGVSPQFDRAAGYADDRSTVEATNTQLAATLEQLEEQSANLATYEAELAAAQVQVPSDAAQDAFNDQLREYTDQYGVTLDRYTADAPASYIPATEAATGTSVTAENFFVIGTNVTVRGAYSNITAFVNAMQTGDGRLYVIDHVIYRPASDSDPNFIAAELTGQVYVLLDPRTLPSDDFCSNADTDEEGCTPPPTADTNPWD